MRKGVRGSYHMRIVSRFSKRLLIIILLVLPLVLFNPLFMRIRPVYAASSVGVWESFASAYNNNTDGTTVDAAYAFDRKDYYPTYDTWNFTYAQFEIKGGRWFYVYGWDYSGGAIDHVNFTAVWEVSSSISDDSYRFLYTVDPSATEGVLQGWQTTAQTKTLTTWKQTTDPDGGAWTETKINNINFTVDTDHSRGHDAATIKIWELFISVGYTPPTVSIKPASVVDSTIAPKNPEVLRPDGAGFSWTWDGDYTDWDETTQNGDTDYVNTTAHGKVAASTFGDSSETWDIAGVRVVIWARLTATDADPEEVIPFIRVGTSLKWGPNIPLTTTYTEYKTEWAVNPVTGNNWTWTEINALQAGVRSYVSGSWTGEMRVTQIYLEVVGMRHQVRVHVLNAVNVWGWQFNLSYDSTVLHGVNWAGDDPVYIDPFLSSGGATVLSAPGPGFDNTQGELALTSAFQTTTDPAKLVDGSGNLAAVAFTVVGVCSAPGSPVTISLGPPCVHAGAVHDYDIVLEGLRGVYIKVQKADGSFNNYGAPSIPEFPLGAVMEIALAAVVIYFWWRTKSSNKSAKVTAPHKTL
jgi:hypothetical protein